MGSADRFCCIDPPVPQAVVVQWVNNAHSVMAEDEEVPVVMGTLLQKPKAIETHNLDEHGRNFGTIIRNIRTIFDEISWELY